MKVCIIGHTERNYLPYMDRYTEFLDANHVDYDIICWQREELDIVGDRNEFNYYAPIPTSTFSKITSYYKYGKFIKSIIKKNKYDKIIVLTSVLAVTLSHFLTKEYSGKYIFDIRDYTFEKFPPYKAIIDKLIRCSAVTAISSKGFMEFLSPSPNIVLNHNIAPIEPSICTADIKTKQVINIGFIGGVRYYEENAALISKLKNTFKYQLWYIGQPTVGCDLEGYCAENEITNVSFIGKFQNDQKAELYKNIDIVNSIYGDDSLEVTTALPNRLYEACLFKKPILSSKRTFLGEIIDQYGLGLVVDIERDDVLALLNQYVETFDEVAFITGCTRFIEDVARDDLILYDRLKAFI